MSMVADSIIRALRSIVGEGNSPLHEPRFAGNEQRYVQECIASTYVSSVGADDEVIVPALTSVATANAVRYLGAISHFVDSVDTSLGLDPRAPLPAAESLAQRVINLPSSAGLA